MTYMTPPKPAAIKKFVIRGKDVKLEPAVLALAEHDGEMWATNRYWATRAVRVAPLLDEYNLSADGPRPVRRQRQGDPDR
jgi:hypothetical protein